MLSHEPEGDMRRREFLGVIGGAAAWPASAQQRTATPVIGFLGSGSPTSDAYRLASFRRGLSEAGYTEGRNVAIEFRWAENDYGRLPSLAVDLVDQRVSVIVSEGGIASALAAKAATTSIPIVFAFGADPVKFDLVQSLNRPGRNLTGVSFLINALGAKRLELLRLLVSSASLIGLLTNPSNPAAASDTDAMLAAATAAGQRMLVVSATSERAFDHAFESLIRAKVAGLIVNADAIFTSGREKLVALAARALIPTIYHLRELTEAGGLMSYGTSMLEVHHLVGIYTGKVLGGANPAELPVQQSVKFELVINLKTAKALGVTFPDKLIALADDVIE